LSGIGRIHGYMGVRNLRDDHGAGSSPVERRLA
jgi:hypothetical protein